MNSNIGSYIQSALSDIGNIELSVFPSKEYFVLSDDYMNQVKESKVQIELMGGDVDELISVIQNFEKPASEISSDDNKLRIKYLKMLKEKIEKMNIDKNIEIITKGIQSMNKDAEGTMNELQNASENILAGKILLVRIIDLMVKESEEYAGGFMRHWKMMVGISVPTFIAIVLLILLIISETKRRRS